MNGWLWGALFLGAVPATRPAADVPALRARVSELERQETHHLRTLITLADAAGDTTAVRRAHRGLMVLGAATRDERLRLAVLDLKAGALQGAHAILTDLLRLDRADLRYVYLLAVIAERQGRGAEREALLGRAGRLHPTDKAEHLNSGDFLAGAGLPAYAEREWRRVLDVDQGVPSVSDVEAHARLAALARNRRDHASAIQHYEAALRPIDRGDLEVPEQTGEWLAVELAMTLRDADRIDEARKHRPAVERYYRERLARNPNDAEACNALGWFYAGLGEHLDEGVALLERALAAKPDTPEFLDTLAELYLQKGDPRRSLALIEKALAAGPANLDYYRRQRARFQRAADSKKDVQP